MISIDIPFYQLIKLHNLYMLLYQVNDRRRGSIPGEKYIKRETSTWHKESI